VVSKMVGWRERHEARRAVPGGRQGQDFTSAGAKGGSDRSSGPAVKVAGTGSRNKNPQARLPSAVSGDSPSGGFTRRCGRRLSEDRSWTTTSFITQYWGWQAARCLGGQVICPCPRHRAATGSERAGALVETNRSDCAQNLHSRSHCYPSRTRPVNDRKKATSARLSSGLKLRGRISGSRNVQKFKRRPMVPKASQISSQVTG
jgi:hypothetical protein